MSPRKPLDKSDRFKDVSDAEKAFMQGNQVKPVDAPQTPTEKPKSDRTAKPSNKDVWADLQTPDKEATIRLNVDIPISLNDKLAERARQLRKPKTELVRRLIEWALDESDE